MSDTIVFTNLLPMLQRWVFSNVMAFRSSSHHHSTTCCPTNYWQDITYFLLQISKFQIQWYKNQNYKFNYIKNSNSKFQHLLPDQLLVIHNIFSSTISKFNDMKSQRNMKIMFFLFTERILSSAFKTLSLPFLIKSKAFSICCTTIAKPSLQRGFPVPAKWDLFMKI